MKKLVACLVMGLGFGLTSVSVGATESKTVVDTLHKDPIFNVLHHSGGKYETCSISYKNDYAVFASKLEEGKGYLTTLRAYEGLIGKPSKVTLKFWASNINFKRRDGKTLGDKVIVDGGVVGFQVLGLKASSNRLLKSKSHDLASSISGVVGLEFWVFNGLKGERINPDTGMISSDAYSVFENCIEEGL